MHKQYLLKKEFFKICLAGVLLINLFLWSKTFFAHHDIGDEQTYVGVAMKIDQFGFKEYNIRRINTEKKGELLQYTYSEAETNGDVVNLLEHRTAPSFNQPLFHAPPMFSYLITFSHRLFAHGEPYRVVTRISQEEAKTSLKKKFKAQFYCTIVPVFTGLLCIAIAFLLGKYLFSSLVGIFTAVLITLTPANILAAQIVYAETTLSLFFSLTVLLFYLGIIRKNRLLIILAGVSFGAALLTKNSAVILIIPIICCAYLFRKRTGHKKFEATQNLILFIVVALLLAIPWYLVVTKTYGTPLFNPSQPGISEINQWYRFMKSRPWYTFLLGIPYQVPLYILGYITIGGILLRKVRDRTCLLMAVWYLSFLIILTIHNHLNEMLYLHHRYMVPAYTPLALISAYTIDKIRCYLNQKWSPFVGNTLCGLAFLACAYWSLTIAFIYVPSRVLNVPF